MPATTMHSALRAATRRAHDALEASAFARRLSGPTLDRRAYANYLAAMARVHAQLGESVAVAGGLVNSLRADDARKVAWIERDLAVLGGGRVGMTLDEAQACALLACQAIRMRATRDPDSLLGYLYVVEGAMLGGAVVRRSVDTVLGLEGQAQSYLGGGDAEPGGRFARFTERLNAVGGEADLQQRVCEAATELFGHMADLFAALERQATAAAPRPSVFHLNREAGSHPVTLDPSELDAALRAGEATLRQYPYMLERYGERGLQFTRSDSAWMVSLVTQPQAQVLQQLEWLAGVLASRGMPRLLLESHLRELGDTLSGVYPERGVNYDKLVTVSEDLATRRRRLLSDAQLDELGRPFDAVHVAGALASASTGRLLGSAVADERDGIPGVVAALSGWLRERVDDPRWPALVDDTVARARESLLRP